MSRVALVKGEDRYSNLTAALALLHDDVSQDIKGRRVLIKPNIVNVEHSLSASHRDALQAVLDFVQRYDPEEIVIGEGSALQDTESGFKNFGYLALQERFPKLRFCDFNRDQYSTIKLLNIDRQEIDARIAKTALEDWYRISLTVPKTHETAIITLSMKNMMGCLVGYDKALMHGAPRVDPQVRMVDSVAPERRLEMYKVFHRNVLRLMRRAPPSLSVIDGFVGMDQDGPVYGRPVNLGVAVASTDYVAADTVMAKIMGFNPMDIGYLYYATKEGLGVGDLSQLEVFGEEIRNVEVRFEPHRETRDEMNWKQSEWYP